MKQMSFADAEYAGKRNQALPGHHLIHLDQEAIASGLLFLAGVFKLGEGLSHGALRG